MPYPFPTATQTDAVETQSFDFIELSGRTASDRYYMKTEDKLSEEWHALNAISRIAGKFYDGYSPHIEATIAAVQAMQQEIWSLQTQAMIARRETAEIEERLKFKLKRSRRKQKKLRIVLGEIFNVLEELLLEQANGR